MFFFSKKTNDPETQPKLLDVSAIGWQAGGGKLTFGGGESVIGHIEKIQFKRCLCPCEEALSTFVEIEQIKQ